MKLLLVDGITAGKAAAATKDEAKVFAETASALLTRRLATLRRDAPVVAISPGACRFEL